VVFEFVISNLQPQTSKLFAVRDTTVPELPVLTATQLLAVAEKVGLDLL
jgi:hypothetical protein